MSLDAYVRVGSAPAKIFYPDDERSGVVFVDVAPDGVVADLREAGHRLLESADAIVVRTASGASTEDSLDELATLSGRMSSRAALGVLYQAVGEPSRITWHEGREPAQTDLADVIPRCRSIEVRALTTWGHAIWRGTEFHYRLPSGKHAAEFIRLGSAIASVRDAEALATWLYPDLSDGIGIVHDTGTISAVVLAAIGALKAAGFRPGPVICLDRYPQTDLAVTAAFQRASTRSRSILIVLSVSSSGQVLDRMVAAGHGSPQADCRLHVLVDLGRRGLIAGDLDDVHIERWHPGPEDRALIEAPQDSGRCKLCENQATARLVPIDGQTFDGRMRAAVKRIVPSVSDAQYNWELWEHVDVLRAVSVEAVPDPAVERHRSPRRRMPIRIENQRLLADPAWRTAAIARFRKNAETLDVGIARDNRHTILIPSHERALPGMDELIEALAETIGEVDSVIAFGSSRWESGHRTQIERSQSIVALTLGTVTGTTLQRMLAAVQAVRPRGGYELTAFVGHARPPERRSWHTLENSWARRIVPAWHSYLPDEFSPLVQERLSLQECPQGSEYNDFLEDRLKFLSAPIAGPLFWGTSEDITVSPDSIFGQGIGQRVVYVAVGAAMERARKDTPQTLMPEERVFELPAMVRSYYDPLIVVAMLRWAQPYEIWWGWQENEASTAVGQILERVPGETDRRSEHLGVLLPELLLAGAQGKLPPDALELVRAKARAAASLLSPYAARALALGMALTADTVPQSPKVPT